MLTSRATTASGGALAARRGPRALAAGRRANMSRLSMPKPHTPVSLALNTIGVPSAVALGLRNFPAYRFYSTQTSTTTTTTTTSPPPTPGSATAPKDPNSVSVPPPGAPAPLPPIHSEKAADTALDTVTDEKKEVKKVEKKPTGPWHKRAWAVVKKEAAHYWDGTKLLGHEIKISSKLQWKVLQGGSLTRRERRQVCFGPGGAVWLACLLAC